MNAADLLIEDAAEHLSSCHTQQMCEFLQEGDTSSNTMASAGLLKHCTGYDYLLGPCQWQIKSYNDVRSLVSRQEFYLSQEAKLLSGRRSVLLPLGLH